MVGGAGRATWPSPRKLSSTPTGAFLGGSGPVWGKQAPLAFPHLVRLVQVTAPQSPARPPLLMVGGAGRATWPSPRKLSSTPTGAFLGGSGPVWGKQAPLAFPHLVRLVQLAELRGPPSPDGEGRPEQHLSTRQGSATEAGERNTHSGGTQKGQLGRPNLTNALKTVHFSPHLGAGLCP